MKSVTVEVLNEAVETVREYGATELILFGSALDSSQNARDIDFACRGVQGWKLFGLGAALEERLQMPVDLVPLDEPSRFGRHLSALVETCQVLNARASQAPARRRWLESADGL